jgi:hypothetical protein
VVLAVPRELCSELLKEWSLQATSTVPLSMLTMCTVNMMIVFMSGKFGEAIGVEIETAGIARMVSGARLLSPMATCAIDTESVSWQTELDIVSAVGHSHCNLQMSASMSSQSSWTQEN